MAPGIRLQRTLSRAVLGESSEPQLLYVLLEAAPEGLAAQLPKGGRTDTMFAASRTMTVILKTYAATGENELHRHPAEDHVFVVLDGEAEFYGPAGEVRRVGKYDGVFVPTTAYYCFRAVGDDPLVMLRVGAKTDPADEGGIWTRTDKLDQPTPGLYKGQPNVKTVLYEDRVFG